MEISQKIKEIANNHDYFVGLTRQKYICEKCRAKAPATIFETVTEGTNITVICCSSCGEMFETESRRLG